MRSHIQRIERILNAFITETFASKEVYFKINITVSQQNEQQHRYQLLIDALKYDSIRKFAIEIKISPSTITAAISRNTGVTLAAAAKIKKRFPQVNKDWLLTGQGDMFTTPAETPALNEPENPYASKPAPTGPGFFNWLLRQQQEYIASRSELSGEELEELARIRKKIERLSRETDE